MKDKEVNQLQNISIKNYEYNRKKARQMKYLIRKLVQRDRSSLRK